MVHRAILEQLAALVPDMRTRASDAPAAFPAEDVDHLRRIGVLAAPFDAGELFQALRLLGSGNLAVGRILEGHVNALHLIRRFGTAAQSAAATRDAQDGHLFAIWNTEAPPGVRLQPDGSLSGRKITVSAAGIATRALITIDQDRDNRMLVASLAPGERAGPMQAALQGMRTTASGWVDFHGYRPDPAAWIGGPGDYLREPDFSAGAWRTLAVLVGGLDRLVEELCRQLRARGRDGAPLQRARIASTLIARETAALWVQKCAALLLLNPDPATLVGYVNLARSAVERAAFEAMQLTQQSLGLMALVESNPVELLLRDLTTYLRQPALDEAISEAAAHFVDHAFPLITEVAA